MADEIEIGGKAVRPRPIDDDEDVALVAEMLGVEGAVHVRAERRAGKACRQEFEGEPQGIALGLPERGNGTMLGGLGVGCRIAIFVERPCAQRVGGSNHGGIVNMHRCTLSGALAKPDRRHLMKSAHHVSTSPCARS
jgi:hypothetical protein